MHDKVKLKKYANRRLYDMEKSAYVTLNYVADLIRQGRQVEVIDAKSKEDVTASVLSSIVLEEAKNKNILLPVPVLHLIIQYGDNMLSEFFEKHLQQMIQTYLANRQSVDDQFEKWLEMGQNFSNMTKETMGDLSPFKSFSDQFSSFSHKQQEKKEK